MKKFFIIVISLVIVVIVGYGTAYVTSPVTSTALEEYDHKIGVLCNDAYIVRDETVYFSTSTGVVYNSASEGERVSRDTIISTVYSGNVNGSVLRDLHTIDDNIKRVKANSTTGVFAADETSLENEISSRMGKINSLAAENNIEQIHDYKNDINALRSGETVSKDVKLEDLQERRSSLEAQAASSKGNILSDRSGIFSSYVDGLESVLTAENVKSYSPEYIHSLAINNSHCPTGSNVAPGMPVCKIMNNHIWYILGITDSEHAAILRNNEDVKVEFFGLSGASASGTIEYVSEPYENGDCVFLVQIPSYIDSAFAYRTVNVKLIVEEFSGYKIPTEAIHTGSVMDEFYVYASKGAETLRCDCEVLFTDTTEGYSIIRSKEGAENRLANMDRLIVGER